MDWNASAYHQLSAPQVAWGQAVLARVALEGRESVLDAGCGTGRLTACLLERLPHGRVVGLDSSEAMVAGARVFLTPRFGRLVHLVRADAGQLPFREAFDLIFSTATFHWIQDHQSLFGNVFVALKHGGRLDGQCGGGPNLGRFLGHAAAIMRQPRFGSYFEGWAGPWEFADAETTARRLSAAGFVDIETGVEPAPVMLSDASTFRDFVATAIVRMHLQRLPPAIGHAFLDALVEQAAMDQPPFALDYWRLNFRGRRP
jgi:trans-aconitate methyltransferase